jgi:hypothetical protein
LNGFPSSLFITVSISFLFVCLGVGLWKLLRSHKGSRFGHLSLVNWVSLDLRGLNRVETVVALLKTIAYID